MDGRSRWFVTSNQKEKHELQAGTIETTTKWDGAQLRQEITAAGGLKILRTYELSPDGRRLVVTNRIDRTPGGRDEPPMRVVYDTDAAR